MHEIFLHAMRMLYISCITYGKTFTHIVNSRLKLWADENVVLNDAQAGFRKGRSTIDHNITVHAAIERHLLEKTKLYVAFIDF